MTRNPEVKVLPSGQQVASFGLATDRFYTDKAGQKQQKTEFHNIVAFAKIESVQKQLLTIGKKEIPVSEYYRDELFKRINYKKQDDKDE